MRVRQLVLDDRDPGHERVDGRRALGGEVVGRGRDEPRVPGNAQPVLELAEVLRGHLVGGLDELPGLDHLVELGGSCHRTPILRQPVRVKSWFLTGPTTPGPHRGGYSSAWQSTRLWIWLSRVQIPLATPTADLELTAPSVSGRVAGMVSILKASRVALGPGTQRVAAPLYWACTEH